MDPPLTLSRLKLAAFLTCPRRFQLRYLRALPWPMTPADEQSEQARRLGEQFHQLLHRHFLGLPDEEMLAANPHLRRWYTLFQQQGPQLPDGRRFPEFSLTVPVGRHLLTGRFDLLVLGQDQAHIFDWKTEVRPRSEAALREDLQTRLYLALLVEGSKALEQPVQADQVHITYWYVNDPAAAVTIAYSEGWHKENWAALQEIVAGIDQMAATLDEWPKTDDLAACARCAYQVYCGRQESGDGRAYAELDWEAGEPDELVLQLEPNLP